MTTLDYRVAQQAGRRAGRPFRLALLRRKGHTGRRPHTILRAADVAAIRTWAARDGYGLLRRQQVEALRRRFRVHDTTLVEVLKNSTWFDPGYVPGAPDPAYWRGQSWTVALLMVLMTPAYAEKHAPHRAEGVGGLGVDRSSADDDRGSTETG